jgi:hypothetical protein
MNHCGIHDARCFHATSRHPGGKSKSCALHLLANSDPVAPVIPDDLVAQAPDDEQSPAEFIKFGNILRPIPVIAFAGKHPFNVESGTFVLYRYLERVHSVQRHIEHDHFGPVHFIAMPYGILQQLAKNHLDVELVINRYLRHVVDPIQDDADFPTDGNGVAVDFPAV